MQFLAGYHLDKSTYFPMENGKLIDFNVKNNSEDIVQIQEARIEFDWDGDSFWYETCNIKIKPGETAKLPSVVFKLEDLELSEGSHNFKPAIKYQLLKDGKWQEKIFTSPKGDFFEIKKIPNRGYKVFISHSNEDITLLKKFVRALNHCGIEGYYAESDVEAGNKLWDKIEREIRKADAFLVLWTKAASTSPDVREEIGIAIGAKKKVFVPVVERGVSVVGSIKAREVEWIPYDPSNPTEGLTSALSFIVKRVKVKELKESHLQKQIPV